MSSTVLESRLQSLQQHLQQENPILLEAIEGFRELDRVAYGMGLLSKDESYATQIPWWPLISILGTFSAGKSSFINHYTGTRLQSTGNQAVDDKFSVLCYSQGEDGRVLPGLALDSDMRFPFFKISDEIEKVAEGEGRRIDAYLQLKTSSSENLRGKILIDSPGFDADAQRTSTLRITKHIIDLSDLVLVFFDARHPEPGAMHDTLKHLVEDTIGRNDSNKFLYILNQVDTAAREDNLENIVAAWQRALSQKGLTAGRFFTIYNEDAAVPIEDDAVRQRYENKRKQDMADIHERMHQVEVERAYRIVGQLERVAHDIEERHVPAITALLQRWRQRVMWLDGGLYGLLLVFLLWIGVSLPWIESLFNSPEMSLMFVVSTVLILGGLHHFSREVVTRFMVKTMKKSGDESYLVALRKNTRFWRSVVQKTPTGWGRRAKKRLTAVMNKSSAFVQRLNDQFTNPSGVAAEAKKTETVAPKK
ncbi:MAG: dynamin family protein [Gammaproteobacteria bacterium]|nr:dynamin family protein [Gammaproteobacteria bacterium]